MSLRVRVGHASTLICVVLFTALGHLRASDYGPAKQPNEPSTDVILAAVNLSSAKPDVLCSYLVDLVKRNPSCLDKTIPEQRRIEYAEAVAAAGTADDTGPKNGVQGVATVQRALNENATTAKTHPVRVAEAVLRRLETHGTAAQIRPLYELPYFERTAVARWKVLTTIQGILASQPLTAVSAEVKGKVLLADALRDLSPDRRADLARAMAEFGVGNPGRLWNPIADGLPSYLWIADALSPKYPDAAKDLFIRGLSSNDPAVRLFAALGLGRISDGVIPYRATQDRTAASADRTKWLTGLSVRPATDWNFRDPLADPVVRTHPGGRADLWWLDSDGRIVRRREDVWPGVKTVLPDGTFFSSTNGMATASAWTGPDGEILHRLPAHTHHVQFGNAEWSAGSFTLRDRETRIVEQSVTGQVLWEFPIPDGHASARFVTTGGPGRVILVRYGRVEVLNRRGDVVWAVSQGLDDPRWACAVDSDSILIGCKQSAVIWNRTRGLVKRVPGFISISHVRYHPGKPWLVIDGGGPTAVVYDAKMDRKIEAEQSLGWKNWDPPLRSRWLEKGDRFPDQ